MNAGDDFERQASGETLTQCRTLVAIVLERVGLNLPPLNISGQIPNNGRVHGQRQLIQGFGDQRRFRRGDVGQSAARDARPEMLELSQCGGVKGSGCDAPHPQRSQALTHL